MIAPIFKIEVDERRVVAHFEQFGMTLRTNLHQAVLSLTQELLTQVRSIEPSRTGQLRSLTRSFVDDGPTYIRGSVRVLAPRGQGHNIAAAALEYGAHRAFTVRAHQQRLTEVFGRPVASRFVAVSAYQRRANIAARRFLRGPLEAMRPRIVEMLQEAVDKSVREANQ